MTPENDLSIVERYGSFGLLVCLVLAFAFYVIPYCVRKFGEIVDKFDKALEAERNARTAHDDRANRTLSELTAAVTQLVDRVERVEDFTSGCPHSTPTAPPQSLPSGKYQKKPGGQGT